MVYTFRSFPAESLSYETRFDRKFILSRLRHTEGFEDLRFVILNGSLTEGTAVPGSDIDLTVCFEGTAEERSLFRFHAPVSRDKPSYDLHIFRDLPLYIQVKVLRGTIICCPMLRFLYDVGGDPIRGYDGFKHGLWDYTGEKAIS